MNSEERQTETFTRRDFLRSSSRFAGGAVALSAMSPLASVANAAKRSAKRPNVLLVVVDDMGYSDVGCFGGEIRTPTIDTLARSGVRMTSF